MTSAADVAWRSSRALQPREAVLAWLVEAQQFPRVLERRYFAGHDVFLAGVGGTWANHVDPVERLVGLAEMVVSPAEPKTGRRGSTETIVNASIEEHVGHHVTELADDARVRTYEIMGDRERA